MPDVADERVRHDRGIDEVGVGGGDARPAQHVIGYRAVVRGDLGEVLELAVGLAAHGDRGWLVARRRVSLGVAEVGCRVTETVDHVVELVGELLRGRPVEVDL